MPDPDIPKIIEDLKAWAKEEHGRQMMMSKEIGMSFQAVSKWVRGKCLPSWEAGEKVRKFLAAQKRKKPKAQIETKTPAKRGRPKKATPKNHP